MAWCGTAVSPLLRSCTRTSLCCRYVVERCCHLTFCIMHMTWLDVSDSGPISSSGFGSMNYYPLFRVRSWNNGVRCMSFCILKTVYWYSFGFAFDRTTPHRQMLVVVMRLHPYTPNVYRTGNAMILFGPLIVYVFFSIYRLEFREDITLGSGWK